MPAVKKAAPKTQKKAAAKTSANERGRAMRPPKVREVGAPGTIFHDGFQVFEDINSEWQSLQRRIKLIETMRRTDGQVNAALMACKLPILSSRWLVQPPHDPTREEQDHADFVQDVMDGMDVSWTEFLSQALTCLDFGHSVFEKIYRIRSDGRWVWKNFEPRMQSTITKWNTDDSGHLISIEQHVWKGGTFREIPLAASSLLVFTVGKEGANWQGTSILRAAYKHWYIKDGLYRIDAIAQERHGVGIPIIEMPMASSEEDDRAVEKILKDLRSHEKAYLLIPAGFKVSMMEFHTQMRDPLASIKHHDEKISTNVLAQFINLGFSQTGSRALGQATADFFMASLNYYTSLIGGVLNRSAVPELIDINFGPQKRYPQIVAVPIGGLDFLKMSQAIMMLAQNGLVRPDQAFIEQVHQMLGMPKPDWNEEPIVIEPKANTKQSSSKKPSGKAKKTEPTKEEETDKAALNKIRPAIKLQVESLLKNSTAEGTVRFRSPFEGTLKQALLLASDNRLEMPMAERASAEVTRRLVTAAEMGFVMGGPKIVRAQLRREALRSMEFLLDVCRSRREEAVHAA